LGQFVNDVFTPMQMVFHPKPTLSNVMQTDIHCSIC